MTDQAPTRPYEHPADLLARAAQAMLDAATAATTSEKGRWELWSPAGRAAGICDKHTPALIVDTFQGSSWLPHTAPHMAAWDPHTARAVAAWLEIVAEEMRVVLPLYAEYAIAFQPPAAWTAAFDTARSFLREPA